MANVIQIKRSSTTTVPSTLAVGELAYSELSDKLFIGESGNVITEIAGGAAMIKLAAIEAGATADMTGAEIKAAYEAIADTNAFVDLEKTKLAGIETSADVTDATNVAAAGAVMATDTDASGYSFVIDEDSMATDSTTKVPTQQSVKAYVDTEVANAVTSGVRYQGSYNATTNSPDLDSSPLSSITKGDMYTVTVAGVFFTTNVEVGDVLLANQDLPTTVDHWSVVQSNLEAASIKTNYESNADTNAFTDTDVTKLAGIETGAEVNLTDAEVKTAYEANGDTNALTDTLLSKLNNISANADQYTSWTFGDGTTSEAITTGVSVGIEGAGSVSTSYSTTTNTLTVTGTDTIDYISGGSFNSTTGAITLTGTGNAAATFNMDGRYFIIDTTVLDGGTF